MEVKRYPEGMTGADLRRQLGIPDKPPKQTKESKKQRRKRRWECLQQQFKALKKFRQRFKFALTLPAKISLLREMALLKFDNPKTLEQRRKAFDRRRIRLRAMIFERDCIVCHLPAEHRHHIIQLQNGGINEIANLMPLCNNCHASVHSWMEVKLPPEMGDTMARVEREA